MPRSVGDTGPRGGEAEGRRKKLPEATFEPNVAPPPASAVGNPKGAQEFAEESTVGSVTPEGTYVPGEAAPSAGVSGKAARRAAKAKEKRRYRKRLEKVTNIERSLDFGRKRRAKSYETDKFAELTTKYFERNEDGSVKTKTIQVPVFKTDEGKAKQDEQRYRKLIHQAKLSGASPQAVALLNKAAAKKVIEDNYSLGHNGKIATVPEEVPAIKPGKAHDFKQELSAAQEKKHEIEEGTKSYFFQSKSSKAQEHELMGKLAAQNDSGGILGDIPVVGGYLNDVASDPAGALYRVIAPGPALAAKALGVNFTSEDEKAIGTVSKGIHFANKSLAGSQALQDQQLAASGIPVLSGIPALRKDVVHGLHTGVLTGTEYLTRPGLVIEQGLAASLGAKHASGLDALLHGHAAKNVATGKTIAEKLTGKPQGGLLIDFVTDPTLWVGAGEVKIATGERLVALTDRLEKSGIALNDLPAGLAQDIHKATETGDADTVLGRLEDVAQAEGVPLTRLGKSAADKDAVESWRKLIVSKQERAAKRDAKLRAGATDQEKAAAESRVTLARDRLKVAEKAGDKDAIAGRAKELSDAVADQAKLDSKGKYYMGGKSRQQAAEETVRVAQESKSAPGLRVNIQTPLGKHLTHIDIKLPKKLSDERAVIPDVHVSPVMRKENYKELLNLRRSKIDSEVLKGFDPEIRDATKALKDAKNPAEARIAEENLKDLKRRLDEARVDAKSSIETTKLRTPAEHASQRSARRLAHDLNRISAANSRSVFHRAFANMDDAMRDAKGKQLTEKERQLVGLHMAEYADTGGRDIANAIAPLDDKQLAALERMKQVNYELGRYGLESGTIENLTKDYAYRHVVKGNNPLGVGIDESAAERASTMKAAGNPAKARGYAATAEVSGRGHLATQLQELARGKLSREEALELADKWHERGKVRVIQEDLAHAIQRGHNPREQDMTPLEKEAYEWGRGRQKENGEKLPDLFKDIGATEGQLKLDKSAYDVHNFEEDPFGALTEKEALALKHATAQGSLERLRQMRDAAERPDLQEQLDSIIGRREAEVNSYKLQRNPERKSYTKVNKKLKKLEALRDRPGTVGEGAAAQHMIDKLRKARDERLAAEDDFKDFIPQQASKEYLGSLKDFRDSHPDQFAVLDPKLANYHRSLRESIKSAYTMRWKTADRAYGRSAGDKNLRTPDNRLYYDKRTGEEYIHADPNVFKGAIPEGRLLPARLHADLKSEFFRMGENVAHDLFDDANAGLFAKLSTMTRFSLTTYFPAYHMRNMISDTMNSLLADPGVLFHPLANAKVARDAMLGDKVRFGKINVPGFSEPMESADYLFMMETLGLKSQEHLADFVAAAEKGQLADRSIWKRAGLGRSGEVGQFALRMSARREDIIRMQTMLQRMRRNGGDAAEAAWHTIKYHFDYADLSQWEKRYMRNAFLFYTWYRKNIPLQFLSMIQKPGFFSALTNSYIELAEGATPFNVNWNNINPLLPDLSGPVPNSGLVPDYMTRIMAAPVVNWNGHATAFSLGLPWADMNLVTNFAENPEEGIRSVFNMLTPPARLGAELGFGESLLTGQKLEGYENSTWSNLLGKFGISLPTDDEGRPLLPWQVAVVMNNLFPAVGRGAGYLKPPSSVEDQGRFNSLFGGGGGTFLTGVSITMTPKEGERLDKAYIYKVYERAAQREAVMNGGKANAQRDADLAKFDEQTKEWATDNGVPEKYLHVVQGLGPKWFISKSDRKAATEIGLLDTEEGGIESTIGTKGLFSTGSGGTLEPESYEPPAKNYKSRTEEALDLLGPSKQQGFLDIGAGTPIPKAPEVNKALYNLAANKEIERKLAAGPSAAEQRLHQGKAPGREAKVLPVPKGFPAIPKTKGKGTPQDIQKANHSIGEWLEKSPHGKTPQQKEKITTKHSVQWYKAHPEKANSKDLNYWKAHPADGTGAPVENDTIKVREIQGMPSAPSQEFAEALAHYSGMDPKIAGAWTLSEMGAEVDGGGAGTYNYLGVGYPGEKTALSEEVPTSSPAAAGKFTAEWLTGKYSGAHPAVTGINEILPKSKGGHDINKFVTALDESGWGTDGSHVAENYAGVSTGQKTELENLGGSGYKVVTSRQQARTVIHLANKFAGTQEGSALQQHWAAMSGISSSEAWCSAFLATLMRRVGLPEPANPAGAGTWQQWKGGKNLETSDIAEAHPGDIFTFGSSDPNGDYADHVGLYLGDGEMISGNFGDEVRRGPVSEETRPIQTIIRPHYSGKQVKFKLSTAAVASPGVSEGSSTSSGSEAASGAPGTAQAVLEGAEGQGNKGYHPGRSQEAIRAAKELRGNIKLGYGQGIGKSSSFNPKAIKGPNLLGLSAKIRAEIENVEGHGRSTSLTARTKRKPKFRV